MNIRERECKHRADAQPIDAIDRRARTPVTGAPAMRTTGCGGVRAASGRRFLAVWRIAVVVVLSVGCGGRSPATSAPPNEPRPLYLGCIDGKMTVSHGPHDFDPVDDEDCEQPAPLPDSDQRIAIEARVVSFAYAAMYDHFDDGSFASYDATSVEVVTPDEHAGRTLTFFHDETPPESSVWRRVGRRVRFTIASDSLEEDRQLFTAAAEGIALVE